MNVLKTLMFVNVILSKGPFFWMMICDDLHNFDTMGNVNT